MKECLSNADQFDTVEMDGCFPVNEQLPEESLRFEFNKSACLAKLADK